MLDRTARRIREYAGTDRELLALASLLGEQELARFAAPMAARDLKAAMYASEVMAKGRGMDGKARRRS